MKKYELTEEDVETLRNAKEAHRVRMNELLKISVKQIKEEREKMKVMLTCLEISRRIAAGDKVPQADHQYLMKHDPALYARSIIRRFPKQNPYEYKRISEDDRCKGKPQAGAADGAEPPLSSPSEAAEAVSITVPT